MNPGVLVVRRMLGVLGAGRTLDGSRRQVDSIASNMGHLLGTGLLDPAESAAIARKLAELDVSVEASGALTIRNGPAGTVFLMAGLAHEDYQVGRQY